MLRSSGLRFAFLLALALLAASAHAQAGASSTHAETWRRWEVSFTASQSYANPYLDHTLGVTFTGPSGETHAARGYWDGGDRFKIRFMFPSAGIWSWTTTFSDPADTGLHGRSGQVLVFASGGGNPLYARGALGVSADGRRLVHPDGTPFVVLGDMPWLAYIRASDSEWIDYLDDRVARGFNAVVMSVGATDQGSRNREGYRPFTVNGPHRWTNSFWRNVDDMIQAANDRGMIVVACGLTLSNQFDDAAETLAFVRGFAARVAGNHVILSPRQDWGAGANHVDDGAAAIEAAGSAPLQLITQHLDRRPMPEHGIEFHPEPYLDFNGVQTNKGEPLDEQPTTYEEASRAQLEWVDALYQETPTKPVVVLEGLHENEVDQTLLRREMLRRQAYLSFVRGAVGYASSAFGVWTWGQGAGFRPSWGDQALDDALALPWNDAFEHLADFLAEIDVTTLVPYAESTLVLNQATTFEHTMVMARSADRRLAVAYLPDNAAIQLAVDDFPAPMRARWFRTTTGEFQALAQPVFNTGVVTLVKPATWADAVLVLEAMPAVPGLGGVLWPLLALGLVAARKLGRRAS